MTTTHVFLFAFRAVKVQSGCLSFHMSHHYVVDCGEKGMEKWEAERQSCSLMACKVISCGLVKLKAASLGCNSWQSCPPFTLANPSFRAFSHNQRFMERGRKRRLYEARKRRKWWRQKENCNQAQHEKKFKRQPKRHQDWSFGWCWQVLWACFRQAAYWITTVSFRPPVKHFCIIIEVINMAAGYLLFIPACPLPALVPWCWNWHTVFPVWYLLGYQARGMKLNLFIYLKRKTPAFSLPLCLCF